MLFLSTLINNKESGVLNSPAGVVSCHADNTCTSSFLSDALLSSIHELDFNYWVGEYTEDLLICLLDVVRHDALDGKSNEWY